MYTYSYKFILIHAQFSSIIQPCFYIHNVHVKFPVYLYQAKVMLNTQVRKTCKCVLNIKLIKIVSVKRDIFAVKTVFFSLVQNAIMIRY